MMMNGQDRQMTKSADGIASSSQAAGHSHGSFFGRRKGHKLRTHQTDLMEHLLPRLTLDLATADASDSASLFDALGYFDRRRCSIMDRLNMDRLKEARPAVRALAEDRLVPSARPAAHRLADRQDTFRCRRRLDD